LEYLRCASTSSRLGRFSAIAGAVPRAMKFGRTEMRILVMGAFAVLCAAPFHSQQAPVPQSNPGADCSWNPTLTSDDYYDAVANRIWPPFLPRSQGITIAVGTEKKLLLHTDGQKFELITDTIDMPEKNVYWFIRDLDDSGRLPPDPADAFKLLKIQWETKEISRAEFDKLYGDFVAALSQYVSTVQETSASYMATKLWGGYVDAGYWLVVYDNTTQHFEIHAWDVPLDNKDKYDSMILWERELAKAAEDSFHRPVLGEK
jgi:hypothetical protein